MSQNVRAHFRDVTGDGTTVPRPWKPLKVSAAEIEERLDRLADGPMSAAGRRESMVTHPQAEAPGLGLSPAVDVVLGALLPGESTRPRLRNASSVTMCLGGRGTVRSGDETFAVSHQDVWVLPSMEAESLANDGDEPLRYLTYSNGAVLRTIGAYYEQVGPSAAEDESGSRGTASEFSQKMQRAKELAPPFKITDQGAWLLPYEHLVDPDFHESRALLWPWEEIAKHLGLVRGLGAEYTGRPLYGLYNPATADKNGTTQAFFASIAAVGPNRPNNSHRHISAAINYHFGGSGFSVVDGERIEWGAGDLMLSAPAWSEHAHTTGPDGALILTIQDHPFHIGNESLVWQEELDGPILALGTQAGFQTNRAEISTGS